jgi:hypothetical protein
MLVLSETKQRVPPHLAMLVPLRRYKKRWAINSRVSQDLSHFERKPSRRCVNAELAASGMICRFEPATTAEIQAYSALASPKYKPAAQVRDPAAKSLAIRSNATPQ